MDEAKSEILELNHYYPFGMRMAMHNSKKLANQHYLYNGKEKQEETGWLDYGARMLDISLGRWMCLDPLAEEYINLSPYNYVANNPLKFIDPNGMWIDDYKLNQNGQIEFVGFTDSKTDELYATNKDGAIDKEKTISVKKGTFLTSISSKDGKTNGFTTENISDAKKVYKFAADNNQINNSSEGIEFGYVEYNKSGVNQATVITNGAPRTVGVSKIGRDIESKGGVVTVMSHSHPSSSNPSQLDIKAAISYPTNKNGQAIKRSIYLPLPNKILRYDKTGVMYDKNFSPLFDINFFK
jgi:RHS repeat-associated protein